jgi:hypothetical protein
MPSKIFLSQSPLTIDENVLWIMYTFFVQVKINLGSLLCVLFHNLTRDLALCLCPEVKLPGLWGRLRIKSVQKSKYINVPNRE